MTGTRRNYKSPLYEYPTNVKEALEWLTHFVNDYQDLERVINKIIVSGNITGINRLSDAVSKFIDAISRVDYVKCYKDSVAIKDICKNTGKTKDQTCCRKFGGDDHKCEPCKKKDTCDETCCQYCPQQICARIFCMLVPMIYPIMKYLMEKIQVDKGTEGWKWEPENLNKNKPLGKFLTSCGFDLDKVKNEKLDTVFKNGASTLEDLVKKFHEFTEKIYENLTGKGSGRFLGIEMRGNERVPNSICDVLQWAYFLPYCCSNYKDVFTKLEDQQYNIHIKEREWRALPNTIPLLLLSIEGKGSIVGSTSVIGNALFSNLESLGKGEYIFNCYSSPVKCARMLCLAIPFLWNIFEYLWKECGGRPRVGTAESGAWSKDLVSNNLSNNLSIFLTSCGFTLSNVVGYSSGEDIKDTLDEFIGRVQEFKVRLDSSMSHKDWQFMKDATSSKKPAKEPHSVSEMLQWLYFLPYCSTYKGVINEFYGLVKGKSKVSNRDVSNNLESLISSVPLIFLSVEGPGKYTKGTTELQNSLLSSLLELHNGKHIFDSDTYSDSTKCAKRLLSIVVLLNFVFSYLNRQCTPLSSEVKEKVKRRQTSDNTWNELTLDGEEVNVNGEQWQLGVDKTALQTFFKFMGFNEALMKNGNTGKIKGHYIQIWLMDSTKSLKVLYDMAVIYFRTQASNPGSQKPSTIREIMFWLISLPLTAQYESLMADSNGTIKAKTTDAFGSSGLALTANDVNDKIVITSEGLVVTMISIEGDAKPLLDYLNDTNTFFSLSGKQLKYGTSNNPEECFMLLIEHTYQLHFQLRFLYEMCNVSKANGGWKDCWYSKNDPGGPPSAVQNIMCECSAAVSASNSCYLPLREFLTNGNGQNGPKNKFKLYLDKEQRKEGMKMGFNTFSFPSTPAASINFNGTSIHEILRPLFGNDVKHLVLLSQHLVAIGRREPTSLGDLFDLFSHISINWENFKTHGQKLEKLKDKLQDELKDYKIGDTGTDDSCGQLEAKIKAIIPSTHNKHNDKSLAGLMCSDNTPSCAPYMKPVNARLYSSYVPKIQASNTEDNKFPYLQCLYDILSKLLDGLKKLENDFTNCPCCKSGSCKDIVSCQYAHPYLYNAGFLFGNPEVLNGGSKKNCVHLKTQLAEVLSCDNGSQSALFSAFECVIQVIYSILFMKAKRYVSATYNGAGAAPGLQSTKEELKAAFERYVGNAISQSYQILICTFGCKVFDVKHQCNNCKTRFTAPGPKPEGLYSLASSLAVSKSQVNTIESIITPYSPPHIDRYKYKTFAKHGVKPAADTIDANEKYTFTDAINFHVQGAQCLTPPPVALRSVIDWLLRVTVDQVDKGQEDNNTKKLCDSVKAKLIQSGVRENELQNQLTSLVYVIRYLTGYNNRSEDVTKRLDATLGNDKESGIKKQLKKMNEKINNYMKNKQEFGKELGRALMKSRYKNKTGAENYFKTVIGDLQMKSKEQHKQCDSGLKCTTFRSDTTQAVSHNDGLSLLKNFFDMLVKYVGERMKWAERGYWNNESAVVFRQLERAEKLIETHSGNNGKLCSGYYRQLYSTVTSIALSIHLIYKLNNNDHTIATSEGYRTEIKKLKTALEKTIEGLTENDDEVTKANVNYAVTASDWLIKKTKERTEAAITKDINEAVMGKFAYHGRSNAKIIIHDLVNSLEGVVESYLGVYKPHLDDLKGLCQWLYRMGQLYNAGLRGFVESLVKHLEHIIKVICWIEGIEKMVEKLNDINNKDDVLTVNGLEGDIEHCCNSHNTLYNSKNFKIRDNFFTAFNCRVNNLLASYMLQDADKSLGIQDSSKERRQLLNELRLLALDRYTMEVWQDDKAHIKHWITFNGGILLHSDLDAVKEALQDLTGVDYNPNDKGNIPVQHPKKRNRIHDFNAICVIQKFNFQEPITKLEVSLKELEGIRLQLQEVKRKCDSNNGGNDLSNDSVVTTCCKAVSQFLNEPYGIFQFAKFVHTILGPNIFSAVISALEELRNADDLKGKTQSKDIQKLSFYKSIDAVLNGLESSTGSNRSADYKVETIIQKLQIFIGVIKREYIFSYPVVSATTASLPAGPQNPEQNPLPMTPSCLSNDSHKYTSICQSCYPYLARILIGVIPNLYRHCRLLYEMCNDKTGVWNTDELSMGHKDYYNRYMLSLSVYMSHQGYELLTKEENGVMRPSEFKYELHYGMRGGYIFEKLKEIVSSIYPLDETKTDTLKPLDKLFKTVMDHFKNERDEKVKSNHEQLRKDHEEQEKTKKTGIPFQAPPPVLPSTVRQVLFWLHELDTNKVFYKQLCDYIFTLCRQSSIQIYDGVITHLLKLSASQALEVLATVEDPRRQFPTYLYDLYTEEHYYDYPTVNIPLFFYTFVEKLMGAFLELNFVCVQCQFVGSQGGWNNCQFYGDETAASRYKREVICECKNSFVEYTCSKPLRTFLFSDQKNQLRIPTDRKAYMSKGTMPCKFKLANANAQIAPTAPVSTSVTGSALVEPLQKLVGGHVARRYNEKMVNTLSTVVYLRDLLRYILCLAARPPWSMSENMAFFYRVTESWKNNTNTVAKGNIHLRDAIHAEMSLFPGRFKAELLTTAVERFAGLEDNEHQKNGTASNVSHHYDLRTLMGCKDTKTTGTSGTTVLCSHFMFPLSLDVYTHYDHKNSRAYLSWILNFAFGIYGQLKEMEEEFQKKKCKDSCLSLPKCPGALTALYQSGSSFMDQKALADKGNNRKKTCEDFNAVLHGVVHCTSNSGTAYCTPLHNLIVQCEAFLWSIRFPFSLTQLSLWSVAVLFISYVFVVPLDHFKIKSHLFNRLKYTMHPSLLISDGQRRVSEVAYFTL